MNDTIELSSIESVWNNIRTHLVNERRRIQQEISTYPSPITACDQQFNYLLEERSRISQELARLHKALEEGQKSGEPMKFLVEFVRPSSCLDDETKRKLEGFLNERRPELRMDAERSSG
jgi:hypothetical protein